MLLAALAMSILALPVAGLAQVSGKTPRIAVLEPGWAPGGAVQTGFCLPGFQTGLRSLGYVDGQNVAVEYRFAAGAPGQLRALAAEIVALRPDIVWTHSPAATKAMKQATSTIPIVVGISSDLLEAGLVASLARPGGNLTGFELRDIELTAKRLELLKEAVPAITRVAVLVERGSHASDAVLATLAAPARTLGVVLDRVEAPGVDGLASAFATMAQRRVDAVLVTDVPLFAWTRRTLAELALRHRLPTVAGWRIYGEAGSLVAYGANVSDMCQRSAVYVDKILKGARPGDLPVERAQKFELVINLRTASALGLTIPRSLLSRADEVIR